MTHQPQFRPEPTSNDRHPTAIAARQAATLHELAMPEHTCRLQMTYDLARQPFWLVRIFEAETGRFIGHLPAASRPADPQSES